MKNLKTDKDLLGRLKKSAKTKMTAEEYEAQRESYIRSCIRIAASQQKALNELTQTSQEWGMYD